MEWVKVSLRHCFQSSCLVKERQPEHSALGCVDRPFEVDVHEADVFQPVEDRVPLVEQQF